jgi:hypothetical protein
MDQRGRKSIDAIATASVAQLPTSWPEAPAVLSASERAVWDRIVRTKPADWWGPDTFPLLIAYIRAIVESDVLAEEISELQADRECLKTPEGLERYAQLSRLMSANTQTLARLATKMRLAQQSRYDKRAAATASTTTKATAKPPWMT